MEYLFSSWEIIERKLKSSRHILLAFDYDGTLTPIVKRPELARLSLTMKGLLKALSENPFFHLVIISGRPLNEIKKLVGIKKIIYAGNHGLELKGSDFRYLNPRAKKFQPDILKIYKLLSKELAHLKGVLVENKGLSLSVHYRLVRGKNNLAELNKIFYQVIKPFQAKEKIRLTFGKKVNEIRPPVKWDKGKCLKYLLRKTSPFNFKPLPVVLGDDRTDEDMFRAVKNKGISVFVGRPGKSSSARYYLRNVAEVKKFLEKLIIFSCIFSNSFINCEILL